MHATNYELALKDISINEFTELYKSLDFMISGKAAAVGCMQARMTNRPNALSEHTQH